MHLTSKSSSLHAGLLLAALLVTPAAKAQDEGQPAAARAGSAAAPAPADAAGGKPPVKAAEPADEEGVDDPIDAPVERKGEEQFIGLFITGINKIDPTRNVWEFDAVLHIETKGKIRKCDKKQIQNLFPDGELKKVDEIDESMDGELKSRLCKVTVEESSDVDISRYPFDRPSLTVHVGDEGDAADGVIFKPMAKDGFGIGDKATLPGWEFGELEATALEAKPSEQQASAVEVTLEAHRPFFSSFVKAFLAVMLQLIISVIGLFLPMKVIANRLTLTTAALIAVAATHSTITSQINVPYLTTADKFFMATYLTLLVNLTFNVLLMRADDQKKEGLVKELTLVATIVVPVIGLFGSLAVLSGLV